MSCIDYSMEVWNNNRINNLFGSDYYNNELALEVMKDEIMTNNYKLEKFYLNHKRELLFFNSLINSSKDISIPNISL